MKISTKALAFGTVGIAAAVLIARKKRDVVDGREHAARTVTVRRNADELYDMWCSPEAIPHFLRGVRSVERLDDRRQRWTLAAGGRSTALDIEIVDATPGKRFAWRVAPKGPFEAQGSLTFSAAPQQRGTEVRFSLSLTGPGAKFASAFARLFGSSPPQIAMESLRQFKALAEAGEIPKAVRD